MSKSSLAQALPLRDYQRACIELIEQEQQRGINRQLVSIATGGGKTVIFAHLISRLNRKTLVIAHTNELLEQAKDKILMVNPMLDVGLVNGLHKELDHQVVIASIQSARQPDTLAALCNTGFEVLIADEAHHFAAESPRMVLEALGFYGNSEKLLVGFSATPFRTDEKGLGEVFDEMVFEKSVGSLIEERYLCPPRGVRVTTDLNLREVASNQDDFNSSSLEKVMNTEEVRALAIDAYLKHANGLPTICFGASVAHATDLAQSFLAHDIRAAVVHGSMSKEEREFVLESYRQGELTVLCNCMVLTEGFDAPHTQCVIVARPTRSKGLYRQIVGRGLRKYPGKTECVVIDFCDSAHTLCSAEILLTDAEAAYTKERERKQQERVLQEGLPEKLNKNLKKAYVCLNLLGDSFNWTRNEGNHVLVGNTNTKIHIVQSQNCGYRVVFVDGPITQLIADGLTFEFAFACAEDLAKKNREKFLLVDRDAPWRDRPITDGQAKVFASGGFKSGISQLTRGQASDLIGSGALRRKKK